jgi:hypothetical protein
MINEHDTSKYLLVSFDKAPAIELTVKNLDAKELVIGGIASIRLAHQLLVNANYQEIASVIESILEALDALVKLSEPDGNG